jgi:threonine synthase
VIVPKGKIALGKLAQALVHGAKVIQIDGNFDQALTICRQLAESTRSSWSTRSTPTASTGSAPARGRSSTSSAAPPTCT